MASRSLGVLTLDLIAKVGGFEQGMDRAARVADKRSREISKSALAVGTAMGQFLHDAVVKVAQAFPAVIDGMDELSKAAQKVGLPTEDFSKLSYAAGLADVSMETLVGSLGKLTKSQAAALKSTSEQAKVFAALGIAVTDSSGKLRESDDVLADFADRFKAMDGSPEAMAAGFALFGRSFQELIPLLKDGGDGIRAAGDELQSLGGVLTTEAGQAAEQFNDNLTRLKTAAGGLALQVASDLLPQMVELTDNLVQMSKDGERTAEVANSIGNAFQAAGSIVQFVGGYFTAFGDVVEGLTTGMIGLYEAAAGLVTLDWSRIKAGYSVANEGADLAYYGKAKMDAKNGKGKAAGPDFSDVVGGASRTYSIDAQVAAIKAARAHDEALHKALGDRDPKPKKAGGGSAKAKPGKSDAVLEAERLLETYKRIEASQAEQTALFGQTSEAAKVRYDVEFGELSKLDAAQKAALIVGAEKIDTLRDEADVQEKLSDIENRRVEAIADNVKRNDEMISDMEFELSLIGLTNTAREKEIALRYAGANATAEQIARIGELVDATAKATEQQAFADDTQRSLTDAVVDYATKTKSATEAFGDFADQLFARALQFVADKAIQAMFDAFNNKGSSGSGSTGASGGGWAGILTSIMGAFGGGRASGGPAMAGKFYEVGEGNKPEMFTARGRQYLIPGNNGAVSQMGASGGAMQVNFAIAGNVSRETQMQIANRLERTQRMSAGRNR